MNDSRTTGILRLRHLREVSEAKSEEMAAERDRFSRLACHTSAPRVVSSFNLFQTPAELAARLAGMFSKFGRVLEPSAGLGRLYRAVRAVSADQMTLVDISKDCCGELYRATEGDANARIFCGDFLAMDSVRLGGTFDAIIMNPPFKMGTDIKHVLHAKSLLSPGGRLVSLVAAGPRQRAALSPIVSEWVDLPAKSFASEGTRVGAAIVSIDRSSN